MLFQLNEFILGELRTLRKQQRIERRKAQTSSSALQKSTGLLSSLAGLFHQGNPSTEQITESAQAYVNGMCSLQDEIEEEYDAFLLDPGMGPMCYLTSQGQVLIDGRSWDDTGIRFAEEDEAIAVLVVGAKKLDAPYLLTLIPEAPPHAQTCPWCDGERRAALYPGMEHKFICIICHGRGWADERLMNNYHEHKKRMEEVK